MGYGYWPRMVDAVHCGNCNAVHGEDMVATCDHCDKNVCPSCGDVEQDEDGMPWGWHKPCAAYVNGESDVDPVAEVGAAG